MRCVIGPNGAGKTTFVSMISGHLRPTAGTIWYRGEHDHPSASAARAPGAASGVSSRRRACSTIRACSRTRNSPCSRPRRRPSDGRARIAQVLELVRLADQAEVLARNLSHGQRQWLEIGLLLANDAKLLLLDEPTAGMTAEETAATGQLVRQLDRGARRRLRSSSSTTSISSAPSKRRSRSCTSAACWSKGSFDEIAEDERVREVYLGTAAHA